jgi:hypothetical protein
VFSALEIRDEINDIEIEVEVPRNLNKRTIHIKPIHPVPG